MHSRLAFLSYYSDYECELFLTFFKGALLNVLVNIYIYMLLELDQIYVYDYAMLCCVSVQSNTVQFKPVFPHDFLTTLRSTCIPFPTGLEKQGVASPQVFLVSSFDPNLYDFPTFLETMEREIPSHKRDVLTLAFPNICKNIINKKKEVFKSHIMYYALLSATIAAVPVPGLATAVDVGILVGVLTNYLVGFRLDKKSVENLSNATQIPLEDLRAVLKCHCSGKEVTKEIVFLILKTASLIICLATEEGSRWIPIMGIPIAAALSFASIYMLLSSTLDSLSVDAENIQTMALASRPK